ncbi:RDD family protein [Streptomyces sp. NPDC056600]|uniref:RDD family protein n=1 Tax=Streptomyces sp. NPDC056600 TaxID=3345874 RepID=UPI00368EE903
MSSDAPPPPPPDDDDPFRKRPPSGGGSPGAGDAAGNTGAAPGPGDPGGPGSPYDPPGGPEGPGGAQPQGNAGPGSPYDPGGPASPGGPHGQYGPTGAYGPGGPYSGGTAPDPLAGMPPLADSLRRVGARIIDLILVGVVAGLLAWAFNVDEYEFDADRVDAAKFWIRDIIIAVLYVAYDTIMTARNGQTLGKKLLKLRVANLDDGSTPSLATSLLRAAVLWVPFAFCCACLWIAIAGGWSFFDKPYKQGLHDKAAKTVVVSTEPNT